MPKKQCDHSESRLTCVDCSAPICPSCMVMCAVGNRCKKCTKGFETHVTKMSPWIMVKMIALGFGTSLAIFLAYAATAMIPLVGCMLKLFAAGACGYFSGKYIHKASGYKYGMKLLPFVLTPLIIGLSLNPATSPIYYLGAVVTGIIPFDPEVTMHLSLLPAVAAITVSLPLLRTR